MSLIGKTLVLRKRGPVQRLPYVVSVPRREEQALGPYQRLPLPQRPSVYDFIRRSTAGGYAYATTPATGELCARPNSRQPAPATPATAARDAAQQYDQRRRVVARLEQRVQERVPVQRGASVGRVAPDVHLEQIGAEQRTGRVRGKTYHATATAREHPTGGARSGQTGHDVR